MPIEDGAVTPPATPVPAPAPAVLPAPEIPAPQPPVAQAVASETATPMAAGGQTVVSQVGISDDMKQFLSSSDFKMDWSRRRWVVVTSLSVMGMIMAAITGVLLTLLFFRADSDFENLLDVVTSLIWVNMFAILSIIGTYIGGAQWDATNFRTNVVEILKTSKRGIPPLPPTQ